MAFSFWLAWNVTTRRAVIGISSPVLGLRPGRCGFSRSWKLPKPDSLTLSPRFERDADLLEETLDHVLGFALVEAELLEQQVGQFGFGERHRRSLLAKRGAESSFSELAAARATVASISASVKVRSVSCISTRIARLFLPGGNPAPR